MTDLWPDPRHVAPSSWGADGVGEVQLAGLHAAAGGCRCRAHLSGDLFRGLPFCRLLSIGSYFYRELQAFLKVSSDSMAMFSSEDRISGTWLDFWLLKDRVHSGGLKETGVA